MTRLTFPPLEGLSLAHLSEWRNNVAPAPLHFELDQLTPALSIQQSHAGGLDQFLLGDLGAEIAIVGRPVRPDDGERAMVPDAGCGLRREKVAAGGLEEL